MGPGAPGAGNPRGRDARSLAEDARTRLGRVAFAAVALAVALPLLPPRWLPMVDLPQHELVADALRRHVVDQRISDTVANYFTYNAGFEYGTLALAPLLGVVGAGHVLLALAASGLVFAVARLREELGQDRWPALLAAALALHYAAGWGFANFTLGLPLALFALADAIAIAGGRATGARFARAFATAIALAVTHVLAALTACVAFAFVALPSLLRARSHLALRRWSLAAMPLGLAALYDVAAFAYARAHPHEPWENAWAEGRHAGVVRRLATVVTNTLGTLEGPGDALLLVVLVVLLAAIGIASARAEPRASTIDRTDAPVDAGFLAPGFVLAYLFVPTVFVATFYVGERFAAVALLAAIATVPARRTTAPLRALLALFAIAATLRLESTVRDADEVAHDGLDVLAALPEDAPLLPVNREASVAGFARSPLRHLFARHALRGGATVGYSFLRFESPPVRRRLPPALPDPPPGFEGSPTPFGPQQSWARAWPVLFVVDAIESPFASRGYRERLAPGDADALVLVAAKGRFAAYRWASRRTVETR